MTQILGKAEISYVLEGYDWANLAQNPFTLSFWVKSSVTGIYGITFAQATTLYITTYSITTAD